VKYSSSRQPVNNGPANDTSETIRPLANDTASLTRAQMRAEARTPHHRVNRKALGHMLRSIDLVVTYVLTGAGAVYLSGGNLLTSAVGDVLPLLGFVLVTPWLLAVAGQYHVAPGSSAVFRIARGIIAIGVAGVLTTTLALSIASNGAAGIAVFTAIAAASLAVLHICYAGLIRHWSKAGRLARNIVLVGATANARKLLAANEGSDAVNVVGVFDDRKSRSPAQLAGAPYLGDTTELFDWPLLPQIDRIVLTVTPRAEARVKTMLERLRTLPQPVCLLMDEDGFDPARTSLEDVVGVHATRMSGEEERLGHLLAKRAQDLVVGSILLICAMPVMALIALAVRLDSPGPSLFRQQREGFNGRRITVLKFRTMRHDPKQASKAVRQVEFNDPRVTKLGNFLRKTSLDELPQFWNVITGDMSLVGPRPHAPSMKTGGTETSNLVAEYAHRHRVKPGITGWAQINGSRGPLHTPEAARDRIRWDVDYIAKSGFFFDLWIMAKTLPALLGDKINIR
jgi:Undecaprenyl-phosphate glucose phosphotransferase